MVGSLPVLDIAAVARFILSPECKSIAILTGAGVSVAAGIPDFRSPGGMYDTLNPDLITATPRERALMSADPTYVVQTKMFFANQFPYMEVRRPFILGTRDRKWRATLAHRVFELIHTKTGKLTRLYTQNIDGLDFQLSGLPASRITAVHGSIGRVACEACGFEHDFDAFCDQVGRNIKDIYKIDPHAPAESRNILCDRCSKPTVKPTTVLFGSRLPDEFFERSDEEMPSVDLLIVAGTSLAVAPANSLVYRVPDRCVRLIVNKERVGEDLGVCYDATGDVFAQGECDAVFLDLAVKLGWLADLAAVKGELPEASRTLLESALVKHEGQEPLA